MAATIPLEDVIQGLPVMLAANLAGVDQFVVRDVSAEEVDTITYDQLLVALNTQYAPLATARFLPASRFMPTFGSPLLTATPGRDVQVYLLDSAASEVVACVISEGDIPDGASTYDVFAVWMNVGAGAGNVVIDLQAPANVSVGGTFAPSSAIGAVTAAAGATWVVMSTKLTPTPRTALSANQFVSLVMVRLGADGADTLANDIGFIGFRLVRVS